MKGEQQGMYGFPSLLSRNPVAKANRKKTAELHFWILKSWKNLLNRCAHEPDWA
jgi:hypothetical protein